MSATCSQAGRTAASQVALAGTMGQVAENTTEQWDIVMENGGVYGKVTV